MSQVALIGAGGIGGPMAECLLRKGVDLTVCDLRADALKPLRLLGARVTQRVADCLGADFIIIAVATDAQLSDVALALAALLQNVDGARSPRLIVMSSVLPATISAMADAFAGSKVRVLDAPVSGGRIAASEGQLTILVGGAEDDLAAARPLLDLLGKTVVYCGPLGAGQAVKIVNNILGVANMFLMTEASRLAVELGIDVDWLAQVMEKSSGRNLSTRDYATHKALYRHNTASQQSLQALLNICRKDLALAQFLAQSRGLTLPLLNAIKGAMDNTPDSDIGDHWRVLSQ